MEITEVYENLKVRDEIDTIRLIDPLKPCPDALTLDTSHRSLGEQCNWIIEKAKALSNQVNF